MNRSEFAQILQRATVDALADLRRQVPDESPYAFAIILGQCGNYLGYAIATEEGLRRVALQYTSKGYRYQGWEWEDVDNLEYIAIWLRWSNPDDGWHCGDFPEQSGVIASLAGLVKNEAFGEDAQELEQCCAEALADLQSNVDWFAVAGESLIVGVTYGSDPRDFLRTATRANRYKAVSQLWAEHRRGEELSSQISRPD